MLAGQIKFVDDMQPLSGNKHENTQFDSQELFIFILVNPFSVCQYTQCGTYDIWMTFDRAHLQIDGNLLHV